MWSQKLPVAKWNRFPPFLTLYSNCIIVLYKTELPMLTKYRPLPESVRINNFIVVFDFKLEINDDCLYRDHELFLGHIFSHNALRIRGVKERSTGILPKMAFVRVNQPKDEPIYQMTADSIHHSYNDRQRTPYKKITDVGR